MAHNLSTTFNPHDVARSKVPSLPYRSREGGGLRPRKRSSAQMEMEGKATEWDYVDRTSEQTLVEQAPSPVTQSKRQRRKGQQVVVQKRSSRRVSGPSTPSSSPGKVGAQEIPLPRRRARATSAPSLQRPPPASLPSPFPATNGLLESPAMEGHWAGCPYWGGHHFHTYHDVLCICAYYRMSSYMASVASVASVLPSFPLGFYPSPFGTATTAHSSHFSSAGAAQRLLNPTSYIPPVGPMFSGEPTPRHDEVIYQTPSTPISGGDQTDTRANTWQSRRLSGVPPTPAKTKADAQALQLYMALEAQERADSDDWTREHNGAGEPWLEGPRKRVLKWLEAQAQYVAKLEESASDIDIGVDVWHVDTAM